MSQEQVRKPAPRETKESTEQLAEEDAAAQAAQETPAADLSDSDALLDEIDALLEEQEILTNYRQKGGE
jgi:hypothetical protein